MGTKINLVGQKFSLLLVTGEGGKDPTGKTKWRCLCDCGLETETTGLNLKNGTTKSCGCLRKRPTRHDLSDRRFGKLTAIEVSRVDVGKVWWRCLCSCGNTTIVSVAHLIAKHTTSCGCYRTQTSREQGRRRAFLNGRGEQHPRWIDRSSNDAPKARPSTQKAWRSLVVSRDPECVVCGISADPHAHHLFGYVEHTNLRERLSNGVTVCGAHHRAFHSRFGLRGFSEKDFYDCFNFPYPGIESASITTVTSIGARKVLTLLRTPTSRNLEKARWYLDREIALRESKGR